MQATIDLLTQENQRLLEENKMLKRSVEIGDDR